jgi:hypothetical protein
MTSSTPPSRHHASSHCPVECIADYTVLDMSAICPSDLPFVSWLRIVCRTALSRANTVYAFTFNLSQPGEIAKPSRREFLRFPPLIAAGSALKERKGISCDESFAALFRTHSSALGLSESSIVHPDHSIRLRVRRLCF